MDVKTPKVEHFQGSHYGRQIAGYREANGNNIAFVHGWPTQITTGFSSFFNSIRYETLSILSSVGLGESEQRTFPTKTFPGKCYGSDILI